MATGIRQDKDETERAARSLPCIDQSKNDRIEIWGTRIGRTLSVAAFIVLAVYLMLTYLR